MLACTRFAISTEAGLLCCEALWQVKVLGSLKQNGYLKKSPTALMRMWRPRKSLRFMTNICNRPPYVKSPKANKLPTAKQRELWEQIRKLGCQVEGKHSGAIALHHIETSMGKRKDHDRVICLCYNHHHRPYKKAFSAPSIVCGKQELRRQTLICSWPHHTQQSTRGEQ